MKLGVNYKTLQKYKSMWLNGSLNISDLWKQPKRKTKVIPEILNEIEGLISEYYPFNSPGEIKKIFDIR